MTALAVGAAAGKRTAGIVTVTSTPPAPSRTAPGGTHGDGERRPAVLILTIPPPYTPPPFTGSGWSLALRAAGSRPGRPAATLGLGPPGSAPGGSAVPAPPRPPLISRIRYEVRRWGIGRAGPPGSERRVGSARRTCRCPSRAEWGRPAEENAGGGLDGAGTGRVREVPAACFIWPRHRCPTALRPSGDRRASGHQRGHAPAVPVGFGRPISIRSGLGWNGPRSGSTDHRPHWRAPGARRHRRDPGAECPPGPSRGTTAIARGARLRGASPVRWSSAPAPNVPARRLAWRHRPSRGVLPLAARSPRVPGC